MSQFFQSISSLSAASSSSGINYIDNPDAETDTTGWTTFADAASATPTDGTGGAPTVTWTRTTSTPLVGTASFLFTKDAANRQGEGVSYDFTIDNAFKGKVLEISFDCQIASGTFADNDMSVWIYDVTNAQIIQPAPYLLKNASTPGESYGMEFQTAVDSTSYRLIIYCGSTSSSAYTVKFDNFIVGPQAKLYGSPVTDWVSYTPTGSWSTAVTYYGRWRREGDSMRVQVNIAISGGVDNTALTVNLPSGFTIDTAKLADASPGTAVSPDLGDAALHDSDTAIYRGWVTYHSTSAVYVYVNTASGTYVGAVALSATVPGTWASGDSIDLEFLVPITGWGSSAIMSNDADTRVVAAKYINTAGTSIDNSLGSNTPFATKVYDTHGAWSGSAYVCPTPGKFRVTAKGMLTGVTLSTSQQFSILLYKNNSLVGHLGGVYGNGTSANWMWNGSSTLDCVAGDSLSVRFYSDVTGNLITNSGYNYIDIEKIQGPAQIAASETVVARMTGSSTSIGTSATKVTFTTTSYDSHTGFSSSAYTCQTAGTYSVSAMIRFAAFASWGANEVAEIYIYKNGSQYSYIARNVFQATINNNWLLAGTDDLKCVAGDYIEIYAIQNNSGGGRSLDSGYFNVKRVGNY